MRGAQSWHSLVLSCPPGRAAEQCWAVEHPWHGCLCSSAGSGLPEPSSASGTCRNQRLPWFLSSSLPATPQPRQAHENPLKLFIFGDAMAEIHPEGFERTD